MAKQTFTVGQVLTAAQMTSLQQTAMGGGSTTAKTASYVLVLADAGTVVQMNSASATTITVNTALFAAGDTVQIQNVGSGVCTVTAGTATVSTAGSLALSQYEGGQLYFNTTSAALFFDIVQSTGMTNPMTTTGDIIYSSSGSTPARLGIGTTGQVLNVASGLPAWTTAGSGAVVQVKSMNSSTATSTSSSTFQDSTLTLAITPTSASNKILVIATVNSILRGAIISGIGLQLVRTATSISVFEKNLLYSDSGGSTFVGASSHSFLDSPATTSATTYKVQFRSVNGTNSVTIQNDVANSSLVLMEVIP